MIVFGSSPTTEHCGELGCAHDSLCRWWVSETINSSANSGWPLRWRTLRFWIWMVIGVCSDHGITGFGKSTFTSWPHWTRTIQAGTNLYLCIQHLMDTVTAIKRIMQEARELANDPCTDYSATPLEVGFFLYQNMVMCNLPQDDIFASISSSIHNYFLILL